MTGDEFIAQSLRNPVNAEILRRLPELGAPDSWLVAGCLFQTVWNLRCGQPPNSGIKDYDIFYFDDSDLSYEAEDRVIRAAEGLFADLGARYGALVEVRNQARVHLWYEAKFGAPYPVLRNAQDGIRRFLVAGTCVGLQPAGAGERPVIHAPYGLEDIAAGHLRPNPLIANPARYREKSASYRARWPFLVDLAA